MQRVAFQRQAQPRHACQYAGMARDNAANALGFDVSLRGLHAADASAFDIQPGNFAVLDQINAEGARRTGKTARHRIVVGDAAARLEARPHHRVTRTAGAVKQRDAFFQRLRVHYFHIHPLQDVGVGAALDVAHILQGVAEVIDAALAEKHVEIEVGGQPFPQPQRVFKQRGRLAPKIIRADDGGVARGVAAAKPAAFEHGNAAGAVFFRQIVGGGKAVSAAADDDDVVAVGKRRAAVGGLPVAVVAQAVPEKAPPGITFRVHKTSTYTM